MAVKTSLLFVAVVAVFASERLAHTQATSRQQPPSQSRESTARASGSSLEGVWNFATLTPLERPSQFAGAFMTDQEAETFGRQTFQNVNADRRPPAGASEFGPAINEFWLERGPLARLNGRTMTSLIVDPADGRLPALTARGTAQAAQGAARRFERAEDLSLALRCLRSAAGPPYFPAQPDANLIRITQSHDHVAIVQEKYYETRIIRLDGSPHVSARIRSWMGDSVGRWAGDTLVVETTNFTEKLALGNRFDENLRLIERFTRTNADVLRYEATVDDPTAFTRPWTFVLPMRRTGEELFEFACHEGNYSLPNILRGARAEERER